MRADLPVLILLARSPVPGRAKTRLMPELSAREAAEIAELLIKESARLAVNAWPGPVRLLAWPDLDHEVFDALASSSRIQLGIQVAGDLGQKMREAIRGPAARGTPAAVMGCDVPHCPAAHLLRAYDLLSGGSNVIGPVADGGYYLMGLQRSQPALFSGINWGGADVFADTMVRAAALAVEFVRLDTLRDIDDYRDLVAVSDQLSELTKWRKRRLLSNSDLE